MIDENVSVPGYRLNIKKRLCELELTVIQSQSASFAAVFKNIWPWPHSLKNIHRKNMRTLFVLKTNYLYYAHFEDMTELEIYNFLLVRPKCKSKEIRVQFWGLFVTKKRRNYETLKGGGNELSKNLPALTLPLRKYKKERASFLLFFRGIVRSEKNVFTLQKSQYWFFLKTMS